jgi:hypothetical protein
MDDPQARTRRPAEEVDLDEIPVLGTLDEAVAELLHQGADLAQVVARDLAGEFRQILAHQRGDDADLDALVEVGGARRKTKPHTLSKMDVVHGILVSSHHVGVFIGPKILPVA